MPPPYTRPAPPRALSALIAAGAALAVLGVAPAAHAKNHLWRFTEFFSNADGTVQFIEMQECCGSDVEVQMGSTYIRSDSATYDFPNNLVGLTAHRWLLVATQGFADLPGAPTPDYIMPDGFFDPAGDTLRYRGVTDLVALAPGALPTDGVHSLERDLDTQAITVIVNSPTNFAGDTGSVGLPTPLPTGHLAVWLVLGLLGGTLAWQRHARARPA